jgi:hypothetical protein
MMASSREHSEHDIVRLPPDEEIDAVGVVNDAVEDGVGERGNADQVMPGRRPRRYWSIPKKIARLIGGERFGSPIIQDEQFDAGQGAQEPGVARIAMGDGENSELCRIARVADADPACIG